ncbi:hypothetical protein ACH48_14200 [Aeromonas caviae]|nr:hypothetical protein ACH48_14200 [Aeromonas caviae]
MIYYSEQLFSQYSLFLRIIYFHFNIICHKIFLIYFIKLIFKLIKRLHHSIIQRTFSLARGGFNE